MLLTFVVPTCRSSGGESKTGLLLGIADENSIDGSESERNAERSVLAVQKAFGIPSALAWAGS
jgi:hypothetical protein